MKSKFLTFYSVLVSIIFVFALSFFTLNLFYEYSHGLERTKRRFDHLENVINTATDEKQIVNAIGKLSDFSYLKISSDNKIIYIYPNENAFQNPETKLVKNYKSSYNFDIEASLYTLRPATIHYYARIAFLIIILATTITLIIIICIALNENPKSYVNVEELDDEFIEDLEEDNTDVEILSKNEDKTDIKVEIPESTTELQEELCVETTESEEQPVNEKDVVIENKDEAVEEPLPLPEDHSKPVVIDDMPEPIEINKTSDELLELRLEKELARAIASEVDLSLFLIRVPEIQKENQIYQDVLSVLEEQFQYKDLIFEVNSDCFAAIKLNTTIDEALDFADIINHEINNVISAENKICYIGIAARTLRMLSAKRLVFESKEAMVHAQQDSETPIVAFKVDSEKYMRMMEN